ncbi:MAG: hypothetical protein HON65_08565 [Rhodospirillales bacterium]|nr:hypothetical protein [Rhodospirillales bacterium]
MQRVRDDLADDFSWDTVYADKRTINMVRNLLVSIAPYFGNLNKRIEWMLPIINSHLTPVDENNPVVEWQMTGAMLMRVIFTMYGNLWAMLDDDMERLHLTKTYGADIIDVLSSLKSTLVPDEE